jgi:hypothetical protein
MDGLAGMGEAMSDFHMTGMVDRFGGIHWILLRHGGRAQPVAIISDFELTMLMAEMNEQRADLEALGRKKAAPVLTKRRGRKSE